MTTPHPAPAQGPKKVAIVGLGYVGLPLCLLLVDRGFYVVGIDVDGTKVDRLNAGESYIHHIPSRQIAAALNRGALAATSDFAAVAAAEAIIICVPTPLDNKRQPDLTAVRTTAESLVPHLRSRHLVILESSTYPGTTEELLVPILARSGLRAGLPQARAAAAGGAPSSATPADGYFLAAFSPEREDPGNPHFQTRIIPKIVGGIDEASCAAALALYRAVFEQVVPVSSCKVAEMAKLLENIYRCVNIALVNELKVLCHRMEVDPFEVIAAAATKPFGFQAFYPGPGLGGHCIPVDPFYLTWKAREFDFSTRFIELAGEINSDMPYYVLRRIGEALNRQKAAINGAKLLILGVAYKRDIDDIRESPALKVIELLRAAGAQVDYNDPYCPRLGTGRHYNLGMESVPFNAETLAGYDAVVIITDHSCYDYPLIARHARLVVDTRNATRGLTGNIFPA